MGFLKNKTAFIAHPAVWIAIAFILGVVVTILWAQQYVSVPFPFCK